MTSAKIGEKAPDFNLQVFDPAEPNNTNKFVSLKNYSGHWLTLFFYPMDFTFVCPTEILGLASRKAEFSEIETEILGVSTDT